MVICKLVLPVSCWLFLQRSFFAFRFVTLTKGEAIESDDYAFNIPCGERMRSGKDSKATRSQQAMGGDGKLPPSGFVLRNNAARGGSSGLGPV